jgi:hypothetical protein
MLSLGLSSGDQNGHNAGKWFVGDLSSYGFYARTLVIEHVQNNLRQLKFINADNTNNWQSFAIQSFYGASTSPFVSIGGKLTQLVRSGRVWNTVTETFEDNGLLTSSDADTLSNYVTLPLGAGYVWATYRAVWKLDSTGNVSKVADVPAGYYTQSCVFDTSASWFVFKSETLADSNAQAVRIATFNLNTNTFTVIGSGSVSAVASLVAMFNGGDGSSPGAAVLGDGRLIGMISPANGTLQMMTQDFISTQTPVALFGVGWSSRQTLPSPTGWLLAISSTANGSQYQITAATDTDAFTLVAPTTEPIYNLHWRPDFEGLVVRWNQGTKLCEQSFSKLQELH